MQPRSAGWKLRAPSTVLDRRSKSGGARVIYFNLTEEEIVLLVALYAKAERSNMSPSEIRKVL